MARSRSRRTPHSLAASRRDPPDWRGALQRIQEDLHAQRLEAAETKLQRLAPGDRERPETRYLLGLLELLRQRPERALPELLRAARERPQDRHLQADLGVVLRRCGRLEEAQAHYDRLMRDHPQDVPLWFNRALVRIDLSDWAGAIADLEQVLALQPEHALASLRLAECRLRAEQLEDFETAVRDMIARDPRQAKAWHLWLFALEGRNRLDELEQQLQDALTHLPEDVGLRVLSARLRRRRQDPQGARASLAGLSAPEDDPDVAQVFHEECKQVAVALGDPAWAMHHAEALNRLQATTHLTPRMRERRQTYLHLLQRMVGRFSPDWVRTWPAADAAERNPVFLIGFPRSGTTLLDQILSSHPAVTVMEEQPALQRVINGWVTALQTGYPDFIPALTPEQIVASRRAYWQYADEYASASQADCFVDKYPLTTQHLGFIHRLFPRAKLLFALRHPLDVVLSGYLAHLRLNESMACLLTLEGATDLYGRLLTLWRQYVQVLPDLDLQIIRYEELVDDPPAVIRRLLDFLELDWDPAVLDHVQTARRKGRINTPSYHQVAQPIYHHARYRWWAYRAFLAPYFDALRPWVGLFGYGALPDAAEAAQDAAPAPVALPAAEVLPALRRLDAAKRCHQAGDAETAALEYQAILEHHPGLAEAWHLLGHSLQGRGAAQPAGQAFQAAVQWAPQNALYQASLGNWQFRHGDQAAAIAAYRAAIAWQPNFAEARHNLAVALTQGETITEAARTEALQHLDAALAIKPDYPEAQARRARLLSYSGRTTDQASTQASQPNSQQHQRAQALWEQVRQAVVQRRYLDAHQGLTTLLALQPNHPRHWAAMAQLALNADDLPGARKAAERALALAPNHLNARILLGKIAFRQQQDQTAREWFEAVLRDAPGHPIAAQLLVELCLRDQNLERAMTVAAEMRARHPNEEGSWIVAGRVADARGQTEQALQQYREGVQQCPHSVELRLMQVDALRSLGHLAEASQLCQTLLTRDPNNCNAFYSYSQCVTLQPDDPRLAAVRAYRDSPSYQEQPVVDRIKLDYALGKAYRDLQQPELSFRHYAEGARLKRQGLVYDEAHDLFWQQQLIACVTKDYLNVLKGHGSPSRQPIFVVGMPRSGTTLVESILASHPDVIGVGERHELRQVFSGWPLSPNQRLPNWDARIPPTMSLVERGNSYLERIRSQIPLTQGARFFVDKMPSNVRWLGLLDALFPQATIIHCVRDPVDTCLSCFMTLFKQGQEWSYDLSELGRYYRRYRALLEHWTAVLGEHRMVSLEYEQLVTEPEQQIRQLLDRCDLDWNPQCLNFHQGKQAVKTASASQVREPIHNRAVQRWHRYEPFLGELLDALNTESSEACVKNCQ